MQKFGKDNFSQSNAWRKYSKKVLEHCESKLYKVKVINPNDYFNFIDDIPHYDTQREVMEFDLNKVRTSDLIFINFNDKYSLGSMAELAIGYEKRIPIIGVNIDKQELHPWQIEMCNRIFTNLDEALTYIIHFYLS